MNRDKQIEDMAEIICQHTSFDTMRDECAESAEALYDAGYRKASDVAREIFEELHREIERALESNYKARRERLNGRGATDNFVNLIDGKIAALRGIDDFIEYLENKYTEVTANGDKED